jgi:hypothetical protein
MNASLKARHRPKFPFLPAGSIASDELQQNQYFNPPRKKGLASANSRGI